MRIAMIALAIIQMTSLFKSDAAEAPALPRNESSPTLSEQATAADAFGYLGGLLEARFYEPHAATDPPRDEIGQAALLYGIDLPMMLSIAKVESDFNPRARTGSYKGLFQLSDYEFEKYGDGSIWDARDNARAAAHMFLVQAERFKSALGHFPDYAERYMVHQQGIEGAIEHYEHPERVAWQSMCATSEGVLKGEQWCKRCIWGNLLPQWKRFFGSVEKISSADFVSVWTGRIKLLADRYATAEEPGFAASTSITGSTNVTSSTSLASSTEVTSSSSRRVHLRAIARRSIAAVYRTAAQPVRAVVAASKAGGLLSRAFMPPATGSTETKPSQPVATAAPAGSRGAAGGLHRAQRQASAASR